MANRQYDTQQKILHLVEQMKSDIRTRNLVGAFSISVNEVPILFTHAGIRPTFFDYLKSGAGTNTPIVTVDDIVFYINEKLLVDTNNCKKTWCKYEDELYEAGPDRYGDGIGGPL